MKMNIKKFHKSKFANPSRGFTLMELMVAIFIFSLIMVSLVSVFVSTTKAYGKARAMKTIKENMEFAMNSIAKDIRMGKIESDDNTESPNGNLRVTRNRSQTTVCYNVTEYTLGVCNSSCASCSNLVDLSTTGMKFDIATSGFRNQKTSPLPPAAPTQRGWAEINLNIIPTGGESSVNMDTDIIHVQTTVSSRDYGWE